MISNKRQKQITIELINAFRSLWCDRGLYSEPYFNCGNCEFQRKDDGKCSVKLFRKNHAKIEYVFCTEEKAGEQE